jgi:hypothetical protein
MASENRPNSFDSAGSLQVGDASYEIYRLGAVEGTSGCRTA